MFSCAQVQKLIVSQTERDAAELEKQTTRAFQLEKDRDELARRVDSLQTQLQHADLKCANIFTSHSHVFAFADGSRAPTCAVTSLRWLCNWLCHARRSKQERASLDAEVSNLREAHRSEQRALEDAATERTSLLRRVEELQQRVNRLSAEREASEKKFTKQVQCSATANETPFALETRPVVSVYRIVQ